MGNCCQANPPDAGPAPNTGGVVSQGKTEEEEDQEQAKAEKAIYTELFAYFAKSDSFELKELIDALNQMNESNDQDKLDRIQKYMGIAPGKVTATGNLGEITQIFSEMSGDTNKVDREMFTAYVSKQAPTQTQARESSSADNKVGYDEGYDENIAIKGEEPAGFLEEKSNSSVLDADQELRLLQTEIKALEQQVRTFKTSCLIRFRDPLI